MTNEKRLDLIDRAKLNKKKKYSFQTVGGCFPKSEWFIKVEDLFAAPRVDAVEVVRCKDCDWYREHEGGICVNPKCGKSWYGCPVPSEHFCSYGERKGK